MPGSQEWTKRVLELIDRDCMDDFEELCELMGVPTDQPCSGANRVAMSPLDPDQAFHPQE